MSINPSGDRISIRDTTVMPSIPGFPALMCLLFSPMVELRCNSDNTAFAGAICGLGYHKKTNESIFPDNDIELTFDVEITLDTIVMVNRIRYWLNRAICPLQEMTSSGMSECQIKLHEHVKR